MLSLNCVEGMRVLTKGATPLNISKETLENMQNYEYENTPVYITRKLDNSEKERVRKCDNNPSDFCTTGTINNPKWWQHVSLLKPYGLDGEGEDK